MAFIPFTDEQNRTLVNVEQHYQVWMEAEQQLAALPYDLRRKEIGGHSYLYEIQDRRGNGKSLGPWSIDLEQRFYRYRKMKEMLQTRRDTSRRTLDESCRLYRALRLPLLASAAGEILREADRRRLLGSSICVVGTNAMPAYAIEAGGFIRDAPDETMDFDMAWTATEPETGRDSVWAMLKAVDRTFTVNSERTFQARNASAYEVELLIAPSRSATFATTDQPRPVPLAEQEWLLLGRPIDHVVVCRDGSPARLVAPDPRWFALQKLWMAAQDKRNPLKRGKDEKQGNALLAAIYTAMPQYPLDEEFEAQLPTALKVIYLKWYAIRPDRAQPDW